MIDQLISALVETENTAADAMLLDALRLGAPPEQAMALDALIRRETTAGLSGVIGLYDSLSEPLQLEILQRIRSFYHALRECGRGANPDLRLAAMKLIALGRQGKLAYVLSENLHESDETRSKAACESVVALARWVATETRKLQNGQWVGGDQEDKTRITTYQELMDNRSEIEAAVARALDVHRGKHGQDLLRATLLLCDWPGSKTLAILHTSKHAGQSPMVRRLQQPPSSENVEAFLLGASNGGLRTHFGVVFSHIEEAPVLDALLRKTHWLKDHHLLLCMHQVNRGVWWGETELLHDIDRRPPEDAAKIGDWIVASGMHDIMQDERMDRLRLHAKDDFAARLRLFRLVAQRKRGASVALFRSFLNDPDERLMRMAAREIIRRKPADGESLLLQMMTSAPNSVRRVVSRAVGQGGFEHFWERFDRMDKTTRRQAGRAMLKLLPDATMRLSRRLTSGPIEQRVKALQIVQELDLAESLRQAIFPLCSHPSANVRSKAVALIGAVTTLQPDVVMDKVLNDADPRVRSNAIEVLETKRAVEYVPLLAQRARSSHNRERANAIKAMHRLRVSTASEQLLLMLRDPRPEHRVSALWTLRQIGWWQLINEVGKIAKADGNLRVRRYALGVLKGVAEMISETKGKAG